ncbi:sulfatase [Flavobacterium cyanobacteriorum]|uniref:Sulfatase n=1 Tax=Flavobacterium cyanobacteriorum TaxID=2022802 RepID=A0A255Z934_9FLAO|nr:alkaline phosphatase family protein [Flavobacterium cyanobacteriorum]OYQ38057.1 sulfatase [Flavobacterium cyanobacteriorum]
MPNIFSVYTSGSVKARFGIATYFIKGFITVSLLIRLFFVSWEYKDVSLAVGDFLRTMITGAFFDFGTALFIALPGILYLGFMPKRLIGTLLDKVLIYVFFGLTILVLVFTFFAEITFWDEFRSRFNFIAVDYLIYTYEVVKNINESYPLPLLISGVLLITGGVLALFYKKKIFLNTFSQKPGRTERMLVVLPVVVLSSVFILFVKNEDAEWSGNRYNNEISKSGIYSFFAAFRNNRIKYDEFYTTIGEGEAFNTIRSALYSSDNRFLDNNSIRRDVVSDGVPRKPNVVFILMESMSASFMKEFGNTNNITPYLDSIASNSIFFKNLYATGTRTVRGMEAVTLCIPPTPGQSIVKRPDNHKLYTVASIFKNKGYDCNFFYGGDGYFDNMNNYFGGNGFTIYDRGRGSILSDAIETRRFNIDDIEVTFENAWGVCDEDIYNKMLTVADSQYKKGLPFFNFIMTTSNHKPYTYPAGKIDIPSGSGRDGAVKYADYALGKMLSIARARPWFKNTVFVIVADHCASSAGKDEIDVAHYHIPAVIYNLGSEKIQIEKQCSQIDLFPTLFSLLHWEYRSNFFGSNVMSSQFRERALIGTYIKLGLMKQDKVIVLSHQKKYAMYSWEKQDNSLKPQPVENSFLKEAVSWYESADHLFSNRLLKESAVKKQ